MQPSGTQHLGLSPSHDTPNRHPLGDITHQFLADPSEQPYHFQDPYHLGVPMTYHAHGYEMYPDYAGYYQDPYMTYQQYPQTPAPVPLDQPAFCDSEPMESWTNDLQDLIPLFQMAMMNTEKECSDTVDVPEHVEHQKENIVAPVSTDAKYSRNILLQHRNAPTLPYCMSEKELMTMLREPKETCPLSQQTRDALIEKQQLRSSRKKNYVKGGLETDDIYITPSKTQRVLRFATVTPLPMGKIGEEAGCVGTPSTAATTLKKMFSPEDQGYGKKVADSWRSRVSEILDE